MAEITNTTAMTAYLINFFMYSPFKQVLFNLLDFLKTRKINNGLFNNLILYKIKKLCIFSHDKAYIGSFLCSHSSLVMTSVARILHGKSFNKNSMRF